MTTENRLASRGQVINERHTLALKQIRSSLVWAADYCGGLAKLRPEHPLRVSIKAVDELLTVTNGDQHG
jgi:hypothetical protein